MQKFDFKVFFFVAIELAFLLAFVLFFAANASRQKLANNFWSEHSVRLLAEEGLLSDLTEASRALGIPFVVYDVTEHVQLRSREIGVYCQDYADVPELQTGRFFDASDSGSQKSRAVVGGEAAAEIHYKNGLSNISADNKELEVVGVLKRYGDYALNGFVYYNLGSDNAADRLLQLDADGHDDVDALLNAVDPGLYKVIILNQTAQERLFHFSAKNALILALLALGMLFSTGCCVAFVFLASRQALGAYWFLGAKASTTRAHYLRMILFSATGPTALFFAAACLVKRLAPVEYTVCYSASSCLAYGCLALMVTIAASMLCLSINSHRGYNK